MEKTYQHRTKLLIGEPALQKLKNIKVILLGVGGVGSWCAEGLIRSGIEHLTIVDHDRVCATNINRQLQATSKTIGEVKVEVLKNRLLEINPEARITAIQKKYSPQNSGIFKLESYDYIIDAIDSLDSKVFLIETALRRSLSIFSSMGAALKLDPLQVKIDSIWNTKGCPLAREVRKALRKKGITDTFTCVYSEEVLKVNQEDTGPSTGDCTSRNSEHESNRSAGERSSEKTGSEQQEQKGCSRINGSVVHMTAMFGFTLSSMVIKDAIKKE